VGTHGRGGKLVGGAIDRSDGVVWRQQGGVGALLARGRASLFAEWAQSRVGLGPFKPGW
jgi:hypothetical protein